MASRPPQDSSADDDDWEDPPARRPIYKWGLGVALPVVFFAFGFEAVFTQSTDFAARFQLILHGLNAIAVGAGAVSVGLCLHCHYFWGDLHDRAWFVVPGKFLGAAGFIAGAVTFIVRVGVLGRH